MPISGDLNTRDFQTALSDAQAEIADLLDRELPRPEIDGERRAEARLLEAMRYACNGGKRLRAFLCLETAALFGVRRANAVRAGAAIECLHAYSLVHDDLPLMDDDDLRRGQPTVHRAYDEATAVLAGDALQTIAFEILADERTHENPFTRCQLVSALAKASGARGMVGGQMIDIEAESADRPLTLQQITRLQRMKTGALIELSCEAGAILGHASDAQHRALDGYARAVGLAFQIADDLLDAEGNADDTGKAVGKDAAAGKATFVSTLGIETARERAEMLAQQAIDYLQPFGVKADLLRDVARFSVARKS